MGKILKQCLVLAIIICMTLVFTACNNTNNDDQSKKDKTFTLTVTPNQEPNGLYLDTKACVLHENSKKLDTVSTIKSNAAYSLTYFDKDKNTVFYTTNTKVNRKGGDQLFSYDVKTKKSVQLTDNLYAINYIIPMKGDNLFLVVIKEGTHNISPGYYNKTTKEFTDLEWDDDFFVSNANKDPQSNEIYVSGYSNTENDKKLDLLNDEKIDGPFGIDNKIYTVSKDSNKLVFELDDRYIDSFAVNGNKLICITSLQGNTDSDKKIIMYDLNTKKESHIDNLPIRGDIFYLDADGANVYANTGEQIEKINIETKKSQILYKLEPGTAWINNAQ